MVWRITSWRNQSMTSNMMTFYVSSTRVLSILWELRQCFIITHKDDLCLDSSNHIHSLICSITNKPGQLKIYEYHLRRMSWSCSDISKDISHEKLSKPHPKRILGPVLQTNNQPEKKQTSELSVTFYIYLQGRVDLIGAKIHYWKGIALISIDGVYYKDKWITLDLMDH